VVAKTTVADLTGLLRGLGLASGDVAMVHCSLFTLGQLPDGPSSLLEALLEVLGESGTLVVPVFTYSFRRNEIFDIRNSPGDPAMGLFSERVRTDPRAVRSACPVFSMSAIGRNAQGLMHRDGPQCFGEGSIYGRLFAMDVKTVGLGVPYSRGLSAFMHLEKLAGVPYRYDLALDGRSIGMEGVLRDDRAIHFARDELQFAGWQTDREEMGRELEAAGIARVQRLHRCNHVCLPATPWKNHVVGRLKRDPLAMLRRDENAVTP
jgi:aminoglycoside 3-N-acetyltransferase